MPRSAREDERRADSSSTPTTLVASARSFQGSKRAKVPKAEEWQREAWRLFDTIDEFHYACTWVGNILSKAILFPTRDGAKTTNPQAVAAMEALFDGPVGQAEMLRQLGIHFTVAGEAWMIASTKSNPTGTGEVDEWLIAASCEVSKTANGAWKVGSNLSFVNPLPVRMWRPHPRYPLLSDSPSRAALPVLVEIEGLTQHVAAQIDSRLSSAGILTIPSEMSFQAATTTNADGTVTGTDAKELIKTLIDTAATAIKNRQDASALVPVVVQGPGEFLDKIQHITFWSGLDENSIALRTEAINRLALGMDMPPEVLTGTGDMNHWGGWQVEEASIKSHTEPLLAIITNALAVGYLQPVLESDGVEDSGTFGIGSDTSKMRLRPNRSAEATELYDRGELNGDALRRENGFEPDDKQNNTDRNTWFLKKVASGSTTPDLVEAALRALGVELGNIPTTPTNISESIQVLPPQTPEQEDEDVTQEARPTPSLKGHPRRDPPDPDLGAAAEVMVFRALERVGNRMRSKMQAKIPGISAAETYMYVPVEAKDLDGLLEDAWSCVDKFSFVTNQESLVKCLDAYVRSLLISNRAHSPSALSEYLALMPKAA